MLRAPSPWGGGCSSPLWDHPGVLKKAGAASTQTSTAYVLPTHGQLLSSRPTYRSKLVKGLGVDGSPMLCSYISSLWPEHADHKPKDTSEQLWVRSTSGKVIALQRSESLRAPHRECAGSPKRCLAATFQKDNWHVLEATPSFPDLDLWRILEKELPCLLRIYCRCLWIFSLWIFDIPDLLLSL